MSIEDKSFSWFCVTCNTMTKHDEDGKCWECGTYYTELKTGDKK
jgi:hypothetical protein